MSGESYIEDFFMIKWSKWVFTSFTKTSFSMYW